MASEKKNKKYTIYYKFTIIYDSTLDANIYYEYKVYAITYRIIIKINRSGVRQSVPFGCGRASPHWINARMSTIVILIISILNIGISTRLWRRPKSWAPDELVRLDISCFLQILNYQLQHAHVPVSRSWLISSIALPFVADRTVNDVMRPPELQSTVKFDWNPYLASKNIFKIHCWRKIMRGENNQHSAQSHTAQFLDRMWC